MTTVGEGAGTARRAIIVGAGGQDGTYLSEYLATLGYAITGISRSHVFASGERRPFSILDPAAVTNLLRTEQPDEIYYVAAHHHSSQESTETLRQLIGTSYDVHCRGLLNVLDAIATVSSGTRLFYAASSLVFGEPAVAPQNEDTPIAPICAYGVTKAAGMGYCALYRRLNGVFAASGILFNHESPRRAPQFVTRKIVQAVSAIRADRTVKLALGDLDVQVDWSYAGDVVRAMHAMLQMSLPSDFVIASGRLHSVRDFVDRAFRAGGLDYRNHVVRAPELLQRNARKVPLHGDAGRLRAATGWSPKVSFDELVAMMVQAESAAAR